MSVVDTVLIIGGYGHVGGVIAEYLAQHSDHAVIVAGRSEAKAQAFAQKYAGRVQARTFDVSNPSEYDSALAGVRLVVMCLEQGNQAIAQACLQRGIHYVDISATRSIHESIEALNPLAREHNATAVLSVGLAPGLTNVLAAYLVNLLDQTDSLEITVMLSLGESHGADSLRWTVDNTNASFYWQGAQTARKVDAFSEPRQVTLPAPFGKRKAYRFDFSDQHILRNTLKVPEVSTRLCFDSAIATDLLALSKRAGVTKLASKLDLKKTAALLEKIPMPASPSAVQVEAFGTRENRSVRIAASATAQGTGLATGLVAALTVQQILSKAQPAGVYHIESLLEPVELMRDLGKEGLEFDLLVN